MKSLLVASLAAIGAFAMANHDGAGTAYPQRVDAGNWARTTVFNGIQPSHGFLRGLAFTERVRHPGQAAPYLVAGLLTPAIGGFSGPMSLPKPLAGISDHLNMGFLFFQGCQLSCDGCSGHYYEVGYSGYCNDYGCPYVKDTPTGYDYNAGSNVCYLVGGNGQPRLLLQQLRGRHDLWQRGVTARQIFA
jgi:hypothetical protein